MVRVVRQGHEYATKTPVALAKFSCQYVLIYVKVATEKNHVLELPLPVV